MGYEHSLNAEINFKPGVTIEAALLALKPLSDYCNWTEQALLANKLPQDDSVVITTEDGVIHHLSLYSGGEVSHSFPDLVDAFAKNLSTIAEPGMIKLRDHDTGDLENAISVIWYGDPAEVAQAQRLYAWHESAVMLRDVGTSEFVLTAMASIGGFGQNRSAIDVKAGDVAGARLFWEELLDSVEALTAIADDHGPRTLADLFYLQNAILSGGFIDCYPGESKVLELVKTLFSGDRWMSYIRVGYLDQPLPETAQQSA
jgi:hypothetical protein